MAGKKYTVKIEETGDVDRHAWIASVEMWGDEGREPPIGATLGHSHIGETPQQALAGLAVYWASMAKPNQERGL